MSIRNAVYEQAFDAEATKIFNGDEKLRDDALRAVEWELVRAPDLSLYPEIANTRNGVLRATKTFNRPPHFPGVVVLFTYDDQKVYLQAIRLSDDAILSLSEDDPDTRYEGE